MKKTLTFVLAAMMILSAVLLSACGGGSSSTEDLASSRYVGTWKATKMALKDDSEALDSEMVMTLNEDGTGEITGDDGPEEITWELTKKGFKTKGETKLSFKDDGENIKTKILGVDLIFEKQ